MKTLDLEEIAKYQRVCRKRPMLQRDDQAYDNIDALMAEVARLRSGLSDADSDISILTEEVTRLKLALATAGAYMERAGFLS